MNMHNDLKIWQKTYGLELNIGSDVIVRDDSGYFEAEYDTDMKQKVVLLYVDGGGLNIGLNEQVPLNKKTRDSYSCEMDGYRIDDLEPSPIN